MDPSFPLVEDDYGAGESELTMDFCAFNARTRIVAYHCIAWGVAVVYACVVGFGYAGPDSTGTFLWCWVPHSSPGARTAMFMAPQSVVMGLLVAVAIGLGCGFTREERASIDFGRRLVPWATFVFAMVQLLWIVTSVLGEEGVGGMDDDQGLGPGSGGGGYDEPSGVSRFMNDFKACLTAGEGLLVAVAVAAAVFVADQRAAVKAWLPLLADLAEGGTEDWEDESDLEEGDEDDEDEEEGDEFGEGEGEGVARGDSLDEEGMRVGGARAAVRGEEKDGGMQEGVPGVDGGPHGLIDYDDAQAMAEMGAQHGWGAAKQQQQARPRRSQDAASGGRSPVAPAPPLSPPAVRPSVRAHDGTITGLGSAYPAGRRARGRGSSLGTSGTLNRQAAASLVAAAEEQRNPYDCAGMSRGAWWSAAVAMAVLSFHHTLNFWTAERSGSQHDLSELAVDAFAPPLLQGIRSGLAAAQLCLIAACVRGCTLTRFQGYWLWVVQLGEETARRAREAVREEEDYCAGVDIGGRRRGQGRDRRRVSEPPPRLNGRLLELAVLAASESPAPCWDPLRCFSVPSGELVGAIASRLARIVGAVAGLGGGAGGGGTAWSGPPSSLGSGGESSTSSALLAGDSLAGTEHTGGASGGQARPAGGGVDDALRMVLEGGGTEGGRPTMPPGSTRPPLLSAPGKGQSYGQVARALDARRFTGGQPSARDMQSPWIKATQHGDRMPWCYPCDYCVVLATESSLAPDHRLVRFRDMPRLPLVAIYGPRRMRSAGLMEQPLPGVPGNATVFTSGGSAGGEVSPFVGRSSSGGQGRGRGRGRGDTGPWAASGGGYLPAAIDSSPLHSSLSGRPLGSVDTGREPIREETDVCLCGLPACSPELCWRAVYQETRLTCPCAFLLRGLLVGLLVVHGPILLSMIGIQAMPSDMAAVYPLAAATQPLVTFVGQVLLCGDTHTLSLSSSLGPLLLALVASGTLLLQVLGVEVPSPGQHPNPPHPSGNGTDTAGAYGSWIEQGHESALDALGQAGSGPGSPRSLERAAGLSIAAAILPAMGALLFGQSFSNPYDRREGVSMRAPAASHVPKAVAMLGMGSGVLLLASCIGEVARVLAGMEAESFDWGLRVPRGEHAARLWTTELAASSRQAIAVVLIVVLLDTAGPIRFGMIWNIVPFGLAVAAAVSPYTPAPSVGNGSIQVVGMAAMLWALAMDSFFEGACCPIAAGDACRETLCRSCCPSCLGPGAPCGPRAGRRGPGNSRDTALEELRTRLRGLDVASTAASSGRYREPGGVGMRVGVAAGSAGGRLRAGSHGPAWGSSPGSRRRRARMLSSRGSASGVIEGVYRTVEARAAGVAIRARTADTGPLQPGAPGDGRRVRAHSLEGRRADNARQLATAPRV